MRKYGGWFNPKLPAGRKLAGRAKPNGDDQNGVEYWQYEPTMATLYVDRQNKWHMTVAQRFTFARPDHDMVGPARDPRIEPRYNDWHTNSDTNTITLSLDPNSSSNSRINFSSDPTVTYAIPPNLPSDNTSSTKYRMQSNGGTHPTVSHIGPWEFTLPDTNRITPNIYMYRTTSNNVRCMDSQARWDTAYTFAFIATGLTFGELVATQAAIDAVERNAKQPGTDHNLTQFRATENGPAIFSFALDISAPAPPLDVKVYKYMFYDRQLLVNFNPHIYEGASAVVGYYVTATAVDGSHKIETYDYNGVYATDHDGIRESIIQTVGQTGRGRLEQWKSYPGRCSITMGGFRQGVSYRITVAAKNGYRKDANDTYGRRSEPSEPSDPVTPITPPLPPTITVTSDGNSGVNVIVKNFEGQFVTTSGITATGDYVKSFRVYSKLNGVDGPSYTYNLDQKIGGWTQSTANLTGFATGQIYIVFTLQLLTRCHLQVFLL